jgi:hypothetical protein
MAINAKSFEDKDFTMTYFQGATDANEIQRKLVADNVTDLNALQLSANLLKWLREAEGDNTVAKQQETDAKMRDINSQLESAKSSNLANTTNEGGDNTSKESSMGNQLSSKTAQSPQSSSGLLANAPTPSK